uniref:Uncharacterized protein n=1 Tax=Anguilla anguilla TaxID=7936 RepID=A0A0E9TZC0_ANGAN
MTVIPSKLVNRCSGMLTRSVDLENAMCSFS